MQRKKALATAASVSAVALAATIALGANVGLFGLTNGDHGPGTFKLVDATTSKPAVRTEIVDVPVSAPSGSDGSTEDSSDPSVSNTSDQETPTVANTPRVDDDRSVGDDSREPSHDEDD